MPRPSSVLQHVFPSRPRSLQIFRIFPRSRVFLFKFPPIYSRLKQLVSIAHYSVYSSPGRCPSLIGSTMAHSVRKATIKDLPAIGAYVNSGSLTLFRQLLADSRSFGAVIETDGRVVGHGWCSGSKDGMDRYNGYIAIPANRALIHHCRIAEEHRGKGLFGSIIVFLASVSEFEVIIDAEEKNIPSRRAIERCGFLPMYKLSVFRIGSRTVFTRSSSV